jgi:molybdopterin converting factor small subunit
MKAWPDPRYDASAMRIQVEFYGISRQRAGTANAVVELDSEPGRLGDVISNLGARFPGLAAICLQSGRLRAGFLVNVGGERFVSDPETPVRGGESLLILSADAGG